MKCNLVEVVVVVQYFAKQSTTETRARAEQKLSKSRARAEQKQSKNRANAKQEQILSTLN